jgi:hypothetical protein
MKVKRKNSFSCATYPYPSLTIKPSGKIAFVVTLDKRDEITVQCATF